jgi:hypothetical protein
MSQENGNVKIDAGPNRRWGFVVPVSALALRIADITILAVTVAQ